MKWCPTLVLLVLLPLATAAASGQPSASQPGLSAQHCASIKSASGRSLCKQFLGAKTSNGVYTAASDWRVHDPMSYECANISASCLIKDMRRPKAGASSCTPATHGAPCGSSRPRGVCIRSNCEVPLVLPRSQSAVLAQVAPGPLPLPTIQLPPPPAPPPPPPVRLPPAPTGALTISLDTSGTLGPFVPPSFLGVSREYGDELFWDRNLQAFGAVFDVLGPSPIIRIGGASQEALTTVPNATYVEGLVRLHCALGVRYIIGLPLFQNAPQLTLAVKNIFDVAFARYPDAILNYELGNEPNYWPTREGGFAPATYPTVCTSAQFNDPSYQLVGVMQPAVGPANIAAGTTTAVRMEPGDGPNPTAGRRRRGLRQAAAAGAPAAEIPNPATYALYRQYQRPWTPYYAAGYCFTQQTTRFTPGWPAYMAYFNFTANAITGCGGPQIAEQAAWGVPYWGPPGFNRRTISGPSWGTLALGLPNLSDFINNGKQCFLREVSLHWYDSGPGTNVGDLLDTTNLANNASVLAAFVAAAGPAGLPIRITESNTVSGGGQAAVSNVMAAALWTAEVAFEFAKAGAAGVNFHWGNGGALDGRSPAYIGVQTFFNNNDTSQPYPQIRAPFYGYMLFARALGGNGPALFTNLSSSAVAAGACGQVVKPYTLLLPAAGLYSVVALNKGAVQGCQLTVVLPGATRTGTLQRLLPGPEGLTNTANGITFAGQTFERARDGRLRGKFSPETVPGTFDGIQSTTYTFYLPAASAALLQIPLPNAAAQPGGRAQATSQLGAGPDTLFAPESTVFGGPGVNAVPLPAPRPTTPRPGPAPAPAPGPVPIPAPGPVPIPAPGPVPIPTPDPGPVPIPDPVPIPAPVPIPGPVPIPAPARGPDGGPPADNNPTGPGGGGGAGSSGSDTPGDPPPSDGPGAPAPGAPAPGAPAPNGPAPSAPAPSAPAPSGPALSGPTPAALSSVGEGGRYVQVGTTRQGGPIYQWVPSGRRLQQGSIWAQAPEVLPAPAPTNLGVIPNSTQVGPLTVGIPGQGGYTLQRPATVAPATAQECPGLAKIASMQTSSGKRR